MGRFLPLFIVALFGCCVGTLHAQETPAPTPTPAAENADDEDAEMEKYDKLTRYWLKPDAFSYAGYEFNRVCNDSDGCRLEIARDGKIVETLTAEDASRLKYAFFPFVRGMGEKQLVVQVDTGGAHCCERYYIYALEPRLHLLYDGSRFDYEEIGDYLEPVDIDRDGTYEFVVDVMAFDYQLDSHSLSPFPPAVFAYDAAQNKYVLANRQFPAYIKQRPNNQERIKYLNALPPAERYNLIDRFLAANQLLHFIYAGEEAAGWRDFDADYHGADKAELRATIKEILVRDVTYRALYPKRK